MVYVDIPRAALGAATVVVPYFGHSKGRIALPGGHLSGLYHRNSERRDAKVQSSQRRKNRFCKAPMAVDSGRLRGPRRCDGGRAHVRTTLSMAVVAATRCSPLIRQVYRTMEAAGKPGLVALIVCMCRLLTMLKAILETQTPWRAATRAMTRLSTQPPALGCWGCWALIQAVPWQLCYLCVDAGKQALIRTHQASNMQQECLFTDESRQSSAAA